jgi:hypothetical protein
MASPSYIQKAFGLQRLLRLMLIVQLCFAAHAHAQTPEEQAAAKETYIEGLRLYPSSTLSALGIRIAYVEQDTSPGGGRYYCGALNSEQMRQAAHISSVALQKIPASGWQRIQMKYLLLCSETKANGRVIGGIPVPPLQLLMVATGASPASSTRFPYTLLHELYHMVEMQAGSYNDNDWNQQFGGYDNSYGSTAGSTALGSGGKGFINGYGKSFPHEERAEIFAINAIAGRNLTQFIDKNGDTKLRAKHDYLRSKCADMLGSGACGQ